ncbi:DUF862 domain-containing protein [Toxoplasma gondii GAB2-2007-GAL-DOM2]|uniref:DUF862 domain-containing protein n=5 Tax=Toxoplasma gondii TaxID=5811 RepID=S7URT5_TOXGG|nr:DUF862 domain-containing protein [Toxoplasma gondii GT1]KAF4643252.1 DUF862 domain-containing protein [Toxoplasma gondii]KFG32997.1 DUF862 domain-containing protein [Toxoplasma gondii GAB2-2007-GAL-DOM2]KFG51326.1 DUF862 domain-containing protein [Toxoplasma gondii FOU]RQX69088.1 DUF862 domain-containing protein [Toxoplasma gondii CAST]
MSLPEQPALPQSGGGKSPSTSGVIPWRTRHTVRLRVFDLSKGMAKLYGGLFVSDEKKGVWHTNVVVFGLEYFYMSTICVCPAGLGWPGEEHLTDCTEMGTTERTPIELEAFLRTQQQIFTPDKYDMFKHNCNHFSDLVLRFLGSRRRVPSYILSLPDRVLQTTLGKLVHPILSVAMDVMKADIRQKADKAELSGEIFFYGGVEPLLDPTESRTRRFLKQVARQVQQERRTHRARHVNSSVPPITERALSSRSSVSPGYKPFPSSFPSPAAFGLSLTPVSPLGHARQCSAARGPACGAAGLRRSNRPSSPAGVSAVNETSLFCLQQKLEAESSLLSPGVRLPGDMEAENREATNNAVDESARFSSRQEGGDEVRPSDPGDKGEGEFLSPGSSNRRALDRKEPTATRTPVGDSPPARFPSRPSRAPSGSHMQRQSSRHSSHLLHAEDDGEAASEQDAFWDVEEASANSGEEWTVLPAWAFASGTHRRDTSAVEEGRRFWRVPPDWRTHAPHSMSHFMASGHTFSGVRKAETPVEWAEAESDGGAGAMRSVFSAGEREDEDRKATGEANASDSDSEHSIRSYTFEDSCPLITAAGGNSPRPSGVSRGDEEDEWQLRGQRRRRMKARVEEGRLGRATGRRQGSATGPEIDSESEGGTFSRRVSTPQRTVSAQDGEQEGRHFQSAQDAVHEGHRTRTLLARSQVRRSQSERHTSLSSSSSYGQTRGLLHARAASGEILFVTPPEQAQRDVWSPPHGSEACSGGEEPRDPARVRRSREGCHTGKGSELEYSDAHEGTESFSEASRDEGASSFLLTSSASHAEDEEEGERSQSWEEEERSANGEAFDSDGGWSASPVKRKDDENAPFERQEREEKSGNDPALAFEIPGEPRWGGGHAGRRRRDDASWLHANPTTGNDHAAQAHRDVLGRRKDEEKLEADFERLHASFFTPPSGAPESSDELEEADAFSSSYPSRSDFSSPSCTELSRVRSKIHRQRTAASSSSTVSQPGALRTVLYRTRSPQKTSVDMSSRDNRRGSCSSRGVNHASDSPASVFAFSTKSVSPAPVRCDLKEGKGRHQSRSRLSESACAPREFESRERRR